MTGTRAQAAFTSSQKTGRTHTAVAAAAVTALSVAALAATWGPARAETIPAEIFVQHDSWDTSRTAATSNAAPVGAEPAAATSKPVLTVTGPGRAAAASAGAAKSPPVASGAAGPAVFIPTVKVAKHTRPFPEQLALQPAALYHELLFTPTSGGPGIALRLFLPAPVALPDRSSAPFGDAAEDDMVALLAPIGGRIAESMAGQGLTGLHQGYLAQIAPGGLESLREARCAAAKQPRPAGCEEPLAADAETGGILTGLGLESIPLPPAAVLLYTALACLAAVTWRRKVQAGKARA